MTGLTDYERPGQVYIIREPSAVSGKMVYDGEFLGRLASSSGKSSKNY